MEQWYRRFVLRDHLHFVERALRESEAKGIIADAGCGGGLFLQMLAERGAVRADGSRGRSRFFDGCGPRGLVARRRSRGLRNAFAGALRPGQLRRRHHVSRPGTPLRSGKLPARRARTAGARGALDRAGAQRRLLAVPAAGRALERASTSPVTLPISAPPIWTGCSKAAGSRCCGTSIFRCATIRRDWPPAWRPSSIPWPGGSARLPKRRPAAVERSAVHGAGGGVGAVHAARSGVPRRIDHHGRSS